MRVKMNIARIIAAGVLLIYAVAMAVSDVSVKITDTRSIIPMMFFVASLMII
jgi:hypothetical protein